MAADLIRYDLLVQDALRGVVRNVLTDAAKNGLQGEHHFFITFKTNAPGLRLSNLMRERYPDEMTVILQHQFWELAVTEHAFEVGLSFSNKPERLLIPFAAITSFVDPSVQFGLKFDVPDPGKPASADGDAAAGEPAKTAPAKRMLAAVDNGSESRDLVALPSIKPAPDRPKPAATAEGETGDAKPDGAAKVVSIDKFRKKP